MFHARARVAVWSVLIVAIRLQVKVSRIEEIYGNEEEEGIEEMKGVSGDEKLNTKVQPHDSSNMRAAEAILHVLPPEIWLLVMGFFKKSWWKTFGQEGRSYSPRDNKDSEKDF
jgi:hypothetical protein